MNESSVIIEQLSQTDAFGEMAPPLQVALFLGGMALLSSMLVTLTSFTRIVIVLSFVRRALSTQEIPPTPVVIGMSLFLTMFVMGPTFEAIHQEALAPYLQEEKSGPEAWMAGVAELKTFMLRQTRTQDIAVFLEMSGLESIETPQDTPMRILIPAFITSELKTAFVMGFCLYIPFLLIDLVVSVVLMSLGMMMMPPVIVSTPFKILLFVLVDGWGLIMRALSLSFM